MLMFWLASCNNHSGSNAAREFNEAYTGEQLNRIAFPVGGIGAGMFCFEGNGSLSHFSLRHKPDIFNRPFVFAAISLKGKENGTKILEGPVQDWRVFGEPNTGIGSTLYGVPRFEKATFIARFPFAKLSLEDKQVPLDVSVTAWSPFTPGDPDNSSLPVGGLEYTFSNPTKETLEAVFSFHSENHMRMAIPSHFGGVYEGGDSIQAMEGGFILSQACLPDKPHYKGEFAIFTDAENAVVDHSWFRGGWFDARTMLWKDISECNTPSSPVTKGATGASIYVPVQLKPGETKTVRVMVSWHVPHSDQRHGWSPDNAAFDKKLEAMVCVPGVSSCCPTEITSGFYEPWYSGKYESAADIARYWKKNYDDLKKRSELFTETFYDSDLPPVVLEAIAANLTILKSPTVLRQKDGRFWGWEGCFDDGQGCCEGSCTHVWNYAQSVSHLFPSLERSLRETEFFVNQDQRGHQHFRANLPIRETGHGWHAAADGQLGGIMKVHREWRISGNSELLKLAWPQVKQSLDFCISAWDPRRKGIIEEPHHNTYDIEFWGPNGMITSFYLGALNAAIIMGEYLGEDMSAYKELHTKGKAFIETELFNGEYFFHKIVTEGLNAADPVTASRGSYGGSYSEEALKLLQEEGPKYQYGTGCLSDGILGSWLASMCGLDAGIDPEKVTSHLNAVYANNFKTDLSDHANPQRASYAYGREGGLLLCTWPKGGEPSLPFVYSKEVWTGIEYQVASHLMLMGEVDKGLEIVKALRKRYDGSRRNPFNEYECGHWYARAMASYGMIQGLTGIFFDAVEQTMHIDSRIGNNFSVFFSCETGFGKVGLKHGKPFAEVVQGSIPVKKFLVSGKEFIL